MWRWFWCADLLLTCSLFPWGTVNTDILFSPVFDFSSVSITYTSFLSFPLYRFPLQGFYKCVSFSTGVILPVHCVCGLHHAAILHAGCHHRQCLDLRLSHPGVECLPVYDGRSHGTNSVAGKAIKHKCEFMVGEAQRVRASIKHAHTSVNSTQYIYCLISIHQWLNMRRTGCHNLQ